MAFHKSNLGAFGNDLPCDIEGYVPQFGDHWSNFQFDCDDYWDSDAWSQFVDRAVEATKQAEAELARWQSQ